MSVYVDNFLKKHFNLFVTTHDDRLNDVVYMLKYPAAERVDGTVKLNTRYPCEFLAMFVYSSK